MEDQYYEESYCAKCECTLTETNYTDQTQHAGEDTLYCDQCWEKVPQSGW